MIITTDKLAEQEQIWIEIPIKKFQFPVLCVPECSKLYKG
jgi:hypothetical protein